MPRWLRTLLFLGVAIAAASGWLSRSGDAPADYPTHPGGSAPTTAATRDAGLPAEAVATLDAIRRGGPFAYDRDGAVFQNREHRLPAQPRGYYREYTVKTPGSSDRGARRMVTGGAPPHEFYYSDDHYRSFRRLEAS